MTEQLLGAIEAGGTKFVCLIGRGPSEILAETRFPTTQPQPTLEAASTFFLTASESGHRVDAIGVGSFGPVELRRERARYGFITVTPKEGWSGTDVAGAIAKATGLPIGFDTDVNAAALAEGRWGAAADVANFIYLTVGTGIGGGAVVDDRLLHGLVHPEMGHTMVPRIAGDRFAGVCPYHSDCLEGMTSGPALQARFGMPAENLRGTRLLEAVELAAQYLAFGLRNLVYGLAPQRIVIGGGVASLRGIVPAVHRHLVLTLGGYPGLGEHESDSFVVASRLGGEAGALGGLILAEHALEATD